MVSHNTTLTMHNPNTTPEQSPLPLVEISLSYYLLLACKGFEQIATVSKPFGNYIKQQIDPHETTCHVEFIDCELAQIYPINEWRSSLIRRAKLEQRSNDERQQRHAIEEKINEEKAKITRRRDLLAECLCDALKMFPVRPVSFDESFIEYLVFRGLNGENKDCALKFGITDEMIMEFKSLPGDPEWRNKHYLGGK